MRKREMRELIIAFAHFAFEIWSLITEDDPVTMRSCHKEEHWQRQPGICSRSNKGLTRELWSSGWPRASGGRDNSLVVWPDNSPNIQHH